MPTPDWQTANITQTPGSDKHHGYHPPTHTRTPPTFSTSSHSALQPAIAVWAPQLLSHYVIPQGIGRGRTMTSRYWRFRSCGLNRWRICDGYQARNEICAEISIKLKQQVFRCLKTIAVYHSHPYSTRGGRVGVIASLDRSTCCLQCSATSALSNDIRLSSRRDVFIFHTSGSLGSGVVRTFQSYF